jgi:hypothetical protein
VGLNTPIQQFVETLNHLNHYNLYFPEEYPKKLDQDEIIKVLNQGKAVYLEWHEAMINSNIDIFKMSYEESASYIKILENLERIRHTNGPGKATIPEDNMKSVTSSVEESSNI